MKDKVATVIVDLKPELNEIFKKIDKDARWGIRKAEANKLTIEESSEWDIFYLIYTEALKKIGIPKETKEHVREHGDVLFICKIEGKPIAGAVLQVIEEIPHLTRAASLEEYRECQPNNLLYWECIKWSKNKGYQSLDLGGWQINARGNTIGVNRFKERWGNVVFSEKEFSFFRALKRKVVRKMPFLLSIRTSIRRVLP